VNSHRRFSLRKRSSCRFQPLSFGPARFCPANGTLRNRGKLSRLRPSPDFVGAGASNRRPRRVFAGEIVLCAGHPQSAPRSSTVQRTSEPCPAKLFFPTRFSTPAFRPGACKRFLSLRVTATLPRTWVSSLGADFRTSAIAFSQQFNARAGPTASAAAFESSALAAPRGRHCRAFLPLSLLSRRYPPLVRRAHPVGGPTHFVSDCNYPGVGEEKRRTSACFAKPFF